MSGGLTGLQLFQEYGTEMIYVARSQGEDHIPFFGEVRCCFDGGRKGLDIANWPVSKFLNSFGQGLTGYALDGLLARGIDVEDDERVGIAEGLGEIVHQLLRSAIAVRLENDMNFAIAALLCGGKGGTDFGRVMAVVVDHTDSSARAPELKAAVNPTEVVEGGADVFQANVETHADRDCRGCVKHVVSAGDVQGELTEILPPIVHAEAA